MSQATAIIIADTPLRWQDVVAVARHGAMLELSGHAWARIDNAQAIVQRIVTSGERAYGVNTGLGALCNVSLKTEQLSQLSRNTLLSHACGVGPVLSDEQTRAIICAAIINYSHGKSGLHPQVVHALLALLNHGITPQVPSQGSVGYLTHMAHIGVALLGVGNVSYRGQIVTAQHALQAEGLQPVVLGAKDGLCLVNGTPCMTGLSCLALADAHHLLQWADVIGAMSFEAQRGQIDAFDEEIIALKPHPGMQQVGINLRALLDGSEVIASSKGIRTQDALSIRSIPQIHGAARDQVEHATRQIETELNSATDNPLVLGTPDSYRVVSQANPHGQSVAMAADMLAIAMAEIGSVAERRLDRLVNPHVSGLPAFLVSNPGGQLRDDDRAVRRRVLVRAEPPVGATRGARQFRHLGPAGRPLEHGHQRRAQAAPGAGQRHPDSCHRVPAGGPGFRVSQGPALRCRYRPRLAFAARSGPCL